MTALTGSAQDRGTSQRHVGTTYPDHDDPKVFRMVDVVLPDSTNHYGTLFAGNVVALMVRAAFLTATRFTRQSIVLAGTERIDCTSPIKQGSIVELIGRVSYSGRSSLTVRVDLFSVGSVYENHDCAAQGYFNLVAVDESGRPVPITRKHEPSSDFERAEWKRIEQFKEFRRQVGEL